HPLSLSSPCMNWVLCPPDTWRTYTHNRGLLSPATCTDTPVKRHVRGNRQSDTQQKGRSSSVTRVPVTSVDTFGNLYPSSTTRLSTRWNPRGSLFPRRPRSPL